MSNVPPSNPEDANADDPQWMRDLQDMAERKLGELGEYSSCEQVHPVIARWYDQELAKDPPPARDAIWQAISCLASEMVLDAEGDDELKPLTKSIDEDLLYEWVEHILTVGRALQIAIDKGELDDL